MTTAIATVSPRPRCACGRARRKSATHCQRCLDAADDAAMAAEPPRKFARQWRAEGWLVAFIDGSAYIAPRDGSTFEIRAVRTTPIDGGRWHLATDAQREPWLQLSDIERARRAPLLRAIARDCYCSSFPQTGCDFCNGTRLPHGESSW